LFKFAATTASDPLPTSLHQLHAFNALDVETHENHPRMQTVSSGYY